MSDAFQAEISNGHLDQLRRAYEGALKPVQEARLRLPPIGSEQSEVLDLLRSHAEQHYGVDAVVEAFTLALAHLFEREMNRATGGALKRRFERVAAFEFLRSNSRDSELETVEALCLSCNVIKHGVGDSSGALYRLRPAQFDEKNKKYWKRDAKGRPMPDYEDLILTETILDEFFRAVRSTFPRRDPNFYKDMYAQFRSFNVLAQRSPDI